MLSSKLSVLHQQTLKIGVSLPFAKCYSEDASLGFEGKMYPRRNIRYALSKDDREDKIGIWQGFDGDFYALPEREREFFGQIGYLHLDSILGEYDVEMHIGEVASNL